jgi:uncharacterized protein (TIGR02001 family)
MLMMALGASFSAVADDASASSDGELVWTGSLALASRYTSRGLDITDGILSPQGAIEVHTASGWYANEFLARIRYFGMAVEADSNVGYRGKVGDLQYDLGLYYYAYPGADPKLHSDFAEAGARFTWNRGLIHPVFELYLSNNYFFGAGAGLFANVGGDVTLPGQVALSARYGYVTVHDDKAFIYPDYTTWSLAATRSFGAWDLSVQATDTSMHRWQCINENRCQLKWTFRLARNF